MTRYTDSGEEILPRHRSWKPDDPTLPFLEQRCVNCGRTWGGHAGRACFRPDSSGIEPARFDLLRVRQLTLFESTRR